MAEQVKDDAELSRDRLRSALLTRCREEKIEPPKTTRIERVNAIGLPTGLFEGVSEKVVAGQRTLEDIIAEAKANEKQFNTRVRTKLCGSYSHHYRRGLPKPLRAVTFGCSNEVFRPAPCPAVVTTSRSGTA